MQLTPLQLQIQERGEDAEYGSLCVFFDRDFHRLYGMVLAQPKDSSGHSYHIQAMNNNCIYREKKDEVELLRKPMNWGRLCYLYNKNFLNADTGIMHELITYFDNNPIYYQQTVLERPTELQELVLKFLSSLPKDAN